MQKPQVNNVRPVVSFLLGSGFSVPEGLPRVTDLNARLAKINEAEILIHSDMQSIFLNGQEDPNRWLRWEERLFVQEFLEFYSLEILKEDEQFHYETFYDFYSGYLYSEQNKEAIEAFYNRFKQRHLKQQSLIKDCLNCIADFNRTFNQLIAELLHKRAYFEDVSLANYPPYEDFVMFLAALIPFTDLKVHSLNHDLFFDHLGRHHSKLWQHFSDGFKLGGSPYYGTVSFDFNAGTNRRVHKYYRVKLEQFIDKFDTPLCFFKLHGSIFNNIVYTDGSKRERLKANYGVSDFYVEANNPATGELDFMKLHSEVEPDFLSGTTNKIRYYSDDPYYANLFKHFENNLLSSEVLVVIGYGFKDSGINDYLENHFLSKGKKMVVIDPYRPNTKLIDKYNAIYIKNDITKVTPGEYKAIMQYISRPS